MKAPSQMKVSTLSFIISLFVFLAIFGLTAYFVISGFMAPNETKEPPTVDENPIDNPIDDPEGSEAQSPEEIEGESFTVLIAGYDLLGVGFDAMAVLEVDKENKKATVHSVNTDTKVYVGHGDSNSLNVRLGDLIKYKDIKYVLDKVNAVTGLKAQYYVTFTAEGFVEAFDAFNKNSDYTYKVPKDMEHLYIAEPVKPEGDAVTPEYEAALAEYELYKDYNISFKKGDSLTKGIDVYNMLRYRGDSVSERISRQSNFVKDIILKIVPARFKSANASAIIDTAKALVKLTDSITTNITVDTFITETFELITQVPKFSLAIGNSYISSQKTNFK